MFKGAIAIFACFHLLFSCAAQLTTQPPPVPLIPPPPQPDPPIPSQSVLLPDLTISDISLSGTGKIEVTISNIGKRSAPYPAGSLVVYVDGLLKWKDSLEALLDQTFLEPGRFVRHPTPIELTGRCEVRAVVDSEGEMVEENEANNSFTKVLGIEKLEVTSLLADLAITDLFLIPPRRLAVTIANVGDSPLPIGEGTLEILVDGSLKGSYPLKSLSDQAFLPVKETMTITTPLPLVGRHEIEAHIDFPNESGEVRKENNSLRRILEGPPVGPDILVKDIELTEDLELMIILSNAGEVDLRKGVIFQIQVHVNDQKISEFDHFISEALKANSVNRYVVAPPYQVSIAGVSRVEVSISPEVSSDDVFLENNVLERTFIVFPFKIGPEGSEEFSFSFFAPRVRIGDQAERVKIEATWEGGSPSLMLSFKKSGLIKGIPPFSGDSPLKIEFSIPFAEAQKESAWSILVTNLIKKRVGGHLIVQHP